MMYELMFITIVIMLLLVIWGYMGYAEKIVGDTFITMEPENALEGYDDPINWGLTAVTYFMIFAFIVAVIWAVKKGAH